MNKLLANDKDLSSCSRCILPYPHCCLLYVEFFVLVNEILRLATKTNNASKSLLEKTTRKDKQQNCTTKNIIQGENLERTK